MYRFLNTPVTLCCGRGTDAGFPGAHSIKLKNYLQQFFFTNNDCTNFSTDTITFIFIHFKGP